MKMESGAKQTIPDEATLLERIKADIADSGKKEAVILAGHFPFIYTEDREVIEGFDKWGPFSRYTLQLGAQIGAHARDLGKKVRFLFLVDDHTYEPFRHVPTTDPETGEKKLVKKQGGISWADTARKNLYQLRSSPDAQLPEAYREIMGQFGFSEADVMRHDQGRHQRRDCLYFAEKILRASQRDIENVCAREMTELIEKHIDKKTTHFVEFIPDRCNAQICDGVMEAQQDLSASSVFIDTDLAVTNFKKLTPETLFQEGRGVTYRRD